MSDVSTAPPRRSWGKYLFLVGLVLISILGWRFGWTNLAGLIQGAALDQLAFMSALILAGFWIRAWKWHRALGPGRQGVRLFFIAKMAGNFTPGRAGELAPLLLTQHRNARVAAWIGLDRLVEVVWTLGLGVLGAAYIGVLPWWSVITMVCGGIAAAVLAYYALRRGWFRYQEVDQAERPMTWWGRAGRLLNNLRDEVTLFGNKMPLIMACTALAKATDIYAVILLCRAFSYDASFLLVSAARCAHALVSAVPVTPDATGVPFIAAAWCLNTYAQIPYDTLTAALGLEVIVINAILWACFCAVSALNWPAEPNDKSARP